MNIKSTHLISAALASVFSIATIAPASAGSMDGVCFNSQWNYQTQSCGVPTYNSGHQYQQPNYYQPTTYQPATYQPATYHQPVQQHTSQGNANDLLVLGGLLVGGAILHNLLDDDSKAKPQVQTAHHIKKPSKPKRSRKHARNKAINACSAIASKHAKRSGYTGANVVKVASLERKGNGRWVLQGDLHLTYKQRVRRHRGQQQWSYSWNSNNGGQWNSGYRQGPKFVTKTVKQSFKCRLKDGEVRAFKTW